MNSRASEERPPSTRHRLVRRQLDRHFGGAEPAAEMTNFLVAVDRAYREADEDRALLEHALEICSRELLDANAELGALLATLPDLVLRIDRDGRVVACFPSSTGSPPFGGPDWIGQSIHDPGLAEFGADILAAIAEALRTCAAAKVESVRVDGTIEIVVEVQLLPVGGGGVLVVARDITARRHTEQLLEHFAFHDPLTGLPNRRLFDDRLANALERCRRHRERFGVLAIDLDRFKEVNDRHGHAAGDRLLRAIAERLRARVRASDTLARVGGDEFMLLVESFRHPEDLGRVAELILRSLDSPVELAGLVHSVSASVGVAIFPYDGDSAEPLLRNADAALYRAKLGGRGHYQIYTPELNAQAVERLELEVALRGAVARRELVLYLEPRFDLETSETVGVATALAWRRGGRLLLADQFMDVAEELGLAGEFGEWALRQACAVLRRTRESPSPLARIAVDLCARRLGLAELLERSVRVLGECGAIRDRIELVLTAAAAGASGEAELARLDELRRAGAGVAVRIGAGEVPLAALARLPLTGLLLDPALIRDCDRDRCDLAVIEAIAALARSQGLRLSASGVEWPSQMEVLRRCGCHEVQGPLFGAAVAAAWLAPVVSAREEDPGAPDG